MLQALTNRLPVALVTALHQSVYLGSTYALLSLLAGFLRSFFEAG